MSAQEPSAPVEAGQARQGELSGLTRVLVDFGPMVVFFLVNAYAPGDDLNQLIWATGGFMVAMVIAMIFSWLQVRRISTMLWVTGAMVLVFGGLTIWLKDETFIKMKPTIVYSMFGAVLLFGLVTGRPLLKLLMGSAFPDLTPQGWNSITRNWALFFFASAGLNEVVWRHYSTDTWVALDTWGMLVISMLFAASQVPLLLRHAPQLAEDDGAGTDKPE